MLGQFLRPVFLLLHVVLFPETLGPLLPQIRVLVISFPQAFTRIKCSSLSTTFKDNMPQSQLRKTQGDTLPPIQGL
ncbi:hypothetical protein R3P38DRAFT_3040196, partial [Favolaschia claudopus]